MRLHHANPRPLLQFGLSALFLLTAVSAVTCLFVLARGPVAALVAVPLGSSTMCAWLCLKACLRERNWLVRGWFLLGVAVAVLSAGFAAWVTLTS